MSPTHRADPELDDLIAEITTDCYDEDEALIGFENAFDEADCLPAHAQAPSSAKTSGCCPFRPPTAAAS